MTDIRILGISGSLRAGSLNTALVRAAQKHAPAGVTIDLYDGLAELPHYNRDLDTEGSLPTQVRELRDRVRASDGLLISTPEYNYSIPGALKNAIDWASRPSATSSLLHKPVAIMGAAPTNFGTVRAQLALRQVFVWTHSDLVVKPEVMVFRAHERFDEAGNLVDEGTITLVTDLVDALAGKIRRPAK